MQPGGPPGPLVMTWLRSAPPFARHALISFGEDRRKGRRAQTGCAFCESLTTFPVSSVNASYNACSDAMLGTYLFVLAYGLVFSLSVSRIGTPGRSKCSRSVFTR